MKPFLQAEQAVLGAILLDPGQLPSLTWLDPAHFYRPAHRALFAAMRKLHADGQLTVTAEEEVAVEWVTGAVAEASRYVRGLSAGYAHTLIAACPRSGHAAVYGRMVLEGAIHRTVTEHAVRLHQAARADALQGRVDGALHHADVLADVLTDLARRWGTEPRPLAPAGSPETMTQPASAATEQALQDEQFLLSVLVNQPPAMGNVIGWLRPTDFAGHGHGQLYRCLGALHHRGEPIDHLTVLWEAQRRGHLAEGTLTDEQLRNICNGFGAGSAEYLGEQTLRSSLTRTAAASASAIRALAQDEALAPGRLINHALHALGPLDEVRARWRTATGEPAAPQPATGGPPTAARIDAALARSQPRLPARPDAAMQSPRAQPPTRTPTAVSPDHPHPQRSHP
ncbi:helicase DnaB [Streptomyces sp. So13.3]|uniref:DnaB-like helicase N-terminal domain-containing protein n=1 Tax=unclassified Streptomyces TaxID=2593676 RepID=UPI0011065714|nr:MULTISPECIES: DnaB-like helicase N-terminal domain-containing protein [unclassified Streptomyces]NEA75445.1 helicase DnaB [Streptomyces sp. SID13588]QNA73126.1 helicase DnaB [Streptomyces sp. So13.3]